MHLAAQVSHTKTGHPKFLIELNFFNLSKRTVPSKIDFMSRHVPRSLHPSYWQSHSSADKCSLVLCPSCKCTNWDLTISCFIWPTYAKACNCTWWVWCHSVARRFDFTGSSRSQTAAHQAAAAGCVLFAFNHQLLLTLGWLKPAAAGRSGRCSPPVFQQIGSCVSK